MSDSSGIPPSGDEWGGSTPPMPEQGMPPRKPSALEAIDARMVEPRFQEANRNFVPIVIGGAVLIVVAVIIAFISLRSNDGGGSSAPVASGEPAATPDDLKVASGYTELTGTDGVSGDAYAVVLQNPNRVGWTAYDVQISGTFIDPAGNTQATITETVAVVSPGQTVAVAGLAAGATDGATFAPTVVVGNWDSTTAPVGAITARSIRTQAVDGAMRTDVTLRSTLDLDSTTNVVAVYYASDGTILGGATSAGTSIPGGGSVAIAITAPYVVADVERTEVYVTASA